MTELLSISAIVESGLCIGCGLCRSIAPANLEIVLNELGSEIPHEFAALDESQLALINRVCPGLHVEGRSPDSGTPETRWDDLWGPAIFIAKAYSSDPDIRFRGSSAGAVSSLAIHLLETGQVDFVAHVAASRTQPMRTEAQLSVTRSDVLRATGSRYSPAAPLVDFVQLLDRRQPFAVIAKPCDISAIQNLSHFDPRVDEFVKCRITFFCGGPSAYSKSTDLIASFGLREDEVSLLRFRGYGNPGRVRLETWDGRAFEVTHNDLWRDEGAWRVPFRCKICGDATGEMADVAISDSWTGGGPVGEDAGFCGLVARTSRGAKLVAEAIEANVLTITQEWDFRDIDAVQPSQIRKKQAVTSRLSAMKHTGLPTTHYEGLRLEEIASTATEEYRRANFDGMLQRLARRKPIEPD